MVLSFSPCDAQPPGFNLAEAAFTVKSKPYAKNARPSEKFRNVAETPVVPKTVRVMRRTPMRPKFNHMIETEVDVRAGIEALRRSCEVVRKMHDLAGDPPLRRQLSGFPGLARIIIGQQVSVASASAIWSRFSTAVQPMSAQAMLSKTDDDLRAAGLSRPKVRTFRAIAQAMSDGLDLDALALIDEADARAQLIAISGVGPWTADVYLMFCLGRADVFAAGDLALQAAAQLAMGLDARPKADELAEIAAARWKPWRAVAARMLWHYYAATKAPKSGQPV